MSTIAQHIAEGPRRTARALALGAVALAAGALAAHAQPRAAVEVLRADAEALRRAQPQLWQQCDDQVAALLRDHVTHYGNWMRRSAPPAPDLAPLQLPLAYLAWRYERAGDVLDLGPRLRISARRVFAAALAASADERRTDFLLARYAGADRDEQRLLAAVLPGALSAARASEVIHEQLSERAPIDVEGLLFRVLHRFAAELPRAQRRECYSYLRGRWTRGPVRDGANVWEVLLRLDAPRAARDLVALDQDEQVGARDKDTWKAVQLLYDYGGADPVVADAARRWLREWAIPTGFAEARLRTVLLRAAPDEEHARFVEYFELRLAECIGDRGPRELTCYLAAGLLHADAPLLRPALRRAAVDARICEAARWGIVERLVRTDDEQAERVVREIVTDEALGDEHTRFRRALATWGDAGRRLSECLATERGAP
ncbi:MAG: hypothetical protein AB7Q17_15020 [Phycisphaerae bacterium]